MTCSYRLLVITAVLILSSCRPETSGTVTESPRSLRGTDFSQLPKIEAEGYTFYDEESDEKDALEILKSAGLNCVRLKVWNNPAGDGSLQELLPYVQRLKDLEIQIMLTLHFSDTWADPGSQAIPDQWANLDFEVLCDSVKAMTFKTVKKLAPDYVQIGNEINHGFMHPKGLRDGDGEFQRLLQAGCVGAKSADSSVITILHYAGYTNVKNFYQTVDSVDYDWIGLSYYPKWHGTDLSVLASKCFELNDTFQRPVALVETSYPFTLDWNDWTNNHIGGSDDLHPDFPATKEGQRAFIATLRELTDSLGTGLVYWGGELVAYKGPQSQSGSPYENQALFDFSGKAVPALYELGAH